MKSLQHKATEKTNFIMSQESNKLSREEKKKVAKKTLVMLERKKKFKAWLNKIFNSNPL